MGLKPFMLASALNCIIWQRLVRKATHPEKVPVDNILDQELQQIISRVQSVQPQVKIPYDGHIYRVPADKQEDPDTYEGRVGVFEILEVNDTLKEAIIEWKSTHEVLDLALQQWFLTLKDDAYVKMLEGKTTLEEILSVL